MNTKHIGWLSLVALGTACGGGNGDAVENGDPGPVAGYDEAIAAATCADFCTLTDPDGCGLESAEVCTEESALGRFGASPEPTAGCASAAQGDCRATCVNTFATSERSPACLGATLRIDRCLFDACRIVDYALSGYGTMPAECAAADDDQQRACAGESHPCESSLDGTCPDHGPYFALDVERNYFDEPAITTMCPVRDDPARAELTLQLMTHSRAGTLPLLPDDRVGDGGERLSTLLAPDAIELENASLDSGAGPATGLTLHADAVRYDPLGGDARSADARMVVLLVDHSGSLIGQPDPATPTDLSAASDRNDQHIAFLKNLVRNPGIPGETYFSLIWFDQRLPHVTVEFATPTRNRDVLVCPSGATGTACRSDAALDGLSSIERGETGGTPLVDALMKTYETILNGQRTRSLNPVVVLFTDGVEGGDTSMSGRSLSEAIELYAGHEVSGVAAPIPVVVLHLAPRAASGFSTAPDEGLGHLACATGGEYLFLSDPEQFASDPRLEPAVVARIFGTWRVSISAPTLAGIGAGPNRLSTDASLTLAGRGETSELRKSSDPTERDPRPVYWPLP